ncbi:MAG: class I SAM-dependent methyltransferase [Chloroflexota bacterium]|nr:class I SAM-dependent methyltransferase [Chloroflexota bacterium]
MPAASAFYDWQLSLIDVRGVYSALDVGCGEGRMTQALRRRTAPGAWIVAVDLQPEAVAATRTRHAVDGLCASIESLPLAPGQFELITAGHVLPSAADIPRAVSELRRVLAPGGALLASADSETSAQRLLDWHVEACRRAGLTDQARRAAAPSARSRFTLENGVEALSGAFRTVDVQIRDEVLAFPSVDALLRLYVNGLCLRGARSLNDPGQAEALAARLSPHLRDIAIAAAALDGRVIVPRRSGCLVARAA